MTILETAKITTKGQITIPNRIRKLLHLKEGATVAFGVSKAGILLMSCEVSATSPYTSTEWAKIEKLAAQKEKIHQTASAAKAHIHAL